MAVLRVEANDGALPCRAGCAVTFGVRLHVWGDYACFTRPEMKTERVSYDVMTPSAGRGILEAIHWKPGLRWVVDRIHVLKEIRFENIRRNEVAVKASGSRSRIFADEERQQRAATLLRDVAYVIDAHFVLSDDDPKAEAKHLSMFNRRAARGQCFHRPYLGTREFPADFALVAADGPESKLPESQRDRELGLMLLDIDYQHDMTPKFFRARLEGGVLDVPRWDSPEVMG